MQNCLGIYIENNLIKYAKLSKDKNTFKVEAYGTVFFENADDAIKKIIEETYSFNTPISINLANEKYLYFDVFSLLSKNDMQKTVQTEYEAYCDENKYNIKAFENRYALVPNVDDKEKVRAIDIIVNKIELNRQKQFLEKSNLTRISPIGISIANIVKMDKKENALIVNMEDKTTITSIYDRQIYNVETIDNGSQEVLEKINRAENSIRKAYDICKGTTIYTASVIDDTREQPYLETIVPTLYAIANKVKEIVAESTKKIDKVYLTGTLANVNNVDLYFQEILNSVECKILKPSIVQDLNLQTNIKDYIEVNSAISLAMQGLGEGIQAFNFKDISFKDKIKQFLYSKMNFGKVKNVMTKSKKDINEEFKEELSESEIRLIRIVGAIIIINIVFAIFSTTLIKQMDKKQLEIEKLISMENAEVSKINNDTSSINSKNSRYKGLTEELKAINDKISTIAEMKNSIPNLLNQIMYVIPEEVVITSIENTNGKNISIVVESAKYDQIGYFIARLKTEGYLKDVVSSSGQKSGNTVKVTIEGVLP